MEDRKRAASVPSKPISRRRDEARRRPIGPPNSSPKPLLPSVQILFACFCENRPGSRSNGCPVRVSSKTTGETPMSRLIPNSRETRF